MTDRESFVRKICEAPDDETSRLVFADWLDEQNTEKDSWLAKMIRGQWQPTSPSRATTTWSDLWKAFKHLTMRLVIDGVVPFDHLTLDGTIFIRRGFLYRLELPAIEFARNPKLVKQLFSTHPIQQIGFTDCEPHEWHGMFWWERYGNDLAGKFLVPSEIFEFLPTVKEKENGLGVDIPRNVPPVPVQSRVSVRKV